MKEAGAGPGSQTLTKSIRFFLIRLLPNKRAGIGPAVKVTRYICLVCHYGCVLYVKGKIIRFRQVCHQFRDNDGRTLWIEQDVP